MHALSILILLLATTLAPAPPDPRLTARWDTATSATIQWTQTARGCLTVEHRTGERAFVGCYEKWPATIQVELGHGQTDGTVRPAGGDVYVLQTQGRVYRAPLRARAVYLGVLRR